MRLILLLLCVGPALAGCNDADARLDQLEADNIALRADLEALEVRLDSAEARLGQRESQSRRTGRTAAAAGDGSSDAPEQAGSEDLPIRCEDDGSGLRVVGELEPNLLSAEVRILPHKNAAGDIDGYRLAAIRRGRTFDSCGFKNGDVVNRLNGLEVTSMDALLAAYSATTAEGEVRIEATRRGRPVGWTIQLQAPQP